jgi:hypothetical protein
LAVVVIDDDWQAGHAVGVFVASTGVDDAERFVRAKEFRRPLLGCALVRAGGRDGRRAQESCDSQYMRGRDRQWISTDAGYGRFRGLRWQRPFE